MGSISLSSDVKRLDRSMDEQAILCYTSNHNNIKGGTSMQKWEYLFIHVDFLNRNWK